MGNWGADQFGRERSHDELFQDTIDKFPQGLKQAMFAAASTGLIKRRDWDGCAFNAAGHQVGKQGSVQSMEAAAETFGVSRTLVSDFILLWDNMRGTDEDCTYRLRATIEKAGLFSGPRTKRRARRVLLPIYKAQQKQLREQFDVLVEADLIPNSEVARDLLVGV